MATTTEQGTGKHPHKSAAEPEPHHEAPTTTGSKASGSHKAETHKAETHKTESHKAEAPKTETHKSETPKAGKSETAKAETEKSTRDGSDLESRAYTGPDGQEHHHTKAYMEQHKGDSKS